MSTIETLRRPQEPPKLINGNTHCSNGHMWTAETTRWRYRVRPDRPGHSYSGWERDCLVCKDMADKARAHRTSGRSRGLVVDVTATGTHWGTTGGAQ